MREILLLIPYFIWTLRPNSVFLEHILLKMKIDIRHSLKILIITLIYFTLGLFVLHPARADGYPHYDIQARLDIEKHSISAHEVVTFTNNYEKGITELYFHIYPNKKFNKKEKEFIYQFAGYFKANLFPDGFQESVLNIHNIVLNQRRLDFSIEDPDATILRVKLPFSLKKGESVKLEIDFDVTIPHAYGRFGWHKDIISLHRWYPLLSVLDDEGWHNYPFYLFHQPYFSDASTYKIDLTLPQDLVIVHSGVLTSRKTLDGGLKEISLETQRPTRDFSLALSPSYKVITKRCGNILVKSFYLQGDEFYAEQAANFACDSINYYSKHYGEYPYSEFSIAPVYLACGGHETSNMIFIDTRVYRLPKFLIRYFDFLISHETGHQWWFNVVGSDEYRQTWLDEGLNSYCLLSYLESKYGDKAEVLELPRFLDWLIPNFTFRDSSIFRYIYMAKNGIARPILGTLSSFKEPSSIFALAYGKGAQVFSMLRYLLGDEAFSRVLSRYYSEFKFKNASVEDFKKIAQDFTDKDLDVFFKQWLETDNVCDYAIAKVEGNRLIIEDKGAISMPLEVKVGLENNRIIRRKLEFKDKREEIIFDADIKSVQLDPENRILEIDKTNNSYPTKVKAKFVPLYFFAYEIPLFLDRGALNIITGPSLASNGLGLKSSLQKPDDLVFSVSGNFNFDDESLNTGVDIIKEHIAGRQRSLGFSFFNEDYHDDDVEDLRGGKIFLRQQLWPAAYGMIDNNDHLTLYLLRNQQWKGSPGSAERIDNLYYRKYEEAIFGSTIHIARRGPYPDFSRGFSFDSTVESAGHFLGGEESFWRLLQEFAVYKPINKKDVIAARIKFGWGGSADKRLFQLGGFDGLRGYQNKSIEGSRCLLLSLEYRLFIIEDLGIALFDNIINIDDIQLVSFFDVGKAWSGNYRSKDFKKDAGLGLRFHVDIASLFERLILRLDVAEAINDPDQDRRVWLGISHTF